MLLLLLAGCGRGALSAGELLTLRSVTKVRLPLPFCRVAVAAETHAAHLLVEASRWLAANMSNRC